MYGNCLDVGYHFLFHYIFVPIGHYLLFFRFSNFAKAGGEAFLMGQTSAPVHVSDSEKVKIIVSLKSALL